MEAGSTTVTSRGDLGECLRVAIKANGQVYRFEFERIDAVKLVRNLVAAIADSDRALEEWAAGSEVADE